jgi:hypothetical protein
LEIDKLYTLKSIGRKKEMEFAEIPKACIEVQFTARDKPPVYELTFTALISTARGKNYVTSRTEYAVSLDNRCRFVKKSGFEGAQCAI